MSTAVSAVLRYGDGELIARAIRGEAESFEQIVHRFNRPVTKFIYRMVGDYETALDLTQEVFLKVYTALDRYDERYRFSTWLFKIASNHTIDYLRKQNGDTFSLDEPNSESEGSLFEAVSDEPSPERQAILNQRRAVIESIIAHLPLSYRQVIVLRHVAELEYEQIAEVSGLPLGTVKNRLFRAREAIRKKLINLGIDGTE
ncbi:MAG: sigma-70 family RNA polymerase sigma factor [Acidobacteria bacterium]|nr:sigma-70 family RNA polymerase sigma factor [Acidobacteriota bacterium]